MSDVYNAPTLHCVNHPETETSLRCNRCERPICTKCAVLTPTGYRCKDCVRGMQKTFETAATFDYPLSFFIAAFLSFLGSLIASVMGFFVIFLAPIAGVIVAEAVRAVVHRRRSRLLFQVATAGAAVGSLFTVISAILRIFLIYSGGGLGASLIGLLPLLWPCIYTFIVTSTVYYRLAGIQLRY